MTRYDAEPKEIGLMKKIMLFSLIAAIFVLASGAAATVRTVSPVVGAAQHLTLNAAYNAAVDGDTIVVGPGTYAEYIYSQKRLHWIGAGWDACHWNVPGIAYTVYLYPQATGSVIEGFDIGGTYYPFYDSADSVTLRRCLVTAGNGYYAVSAQNAGRLTIEDCLLLQTNQADVVYIYSSTSNWVIRNTVFAYTVDPIYASHYALNGPQGGTIEIYNCVFLNMRQVFNLTSSPQVIGLNNIFYDWVAGGGWGTLPAGSVFEYSAADNTAPAFPGSFVNNISLGGDNPFVNYNTATNYAVGTTDLHLNAGAGGLACTDTGYPSILDLDDSRSDLGLFGGPKPFVGLGLPAYPFAITLTIDPLVEVGDSVGVSSTGRIGPRY